MSARPAPGCLWLAGRAPQVIKEHGALRHAELLAILACQPEELRAAIPIMIRWRKTGRCGDYLVAVPPRRKGRPAA
jgi:hypothetical protein